MNGIIFGFVFLRDPVVEALTDADYPCLMYKRRLRSGRGNYIILGLEIIRDPRRFTRQPVQQVLTPTLVVRRSCGAMAVSWHLAPRG